MAHCGKSVIEKLASLVHRYTASNKTVYERFLSLEHILVQDFPPVIAIQHKLVFEKVYICFLIPEKASISPDWKDQPGWI